MKLGTTALYTVLRETNLGYMLEHEGEEFFLHHNECNGRYLKDGEKVEAFLYVDKKKRVAATLYQPYVTATIGRLCDVVAHSPAGVFVHIGISRDILLSSDELEEGKWPQIGDKVCCALKVRGQNIFIRRLNKEEILSMTSTNPLKKDQSVSAYVYRITEKGINLVDEDYHVIFVYYTNLRKTYCLGEKVDVRIISINEQDYSGTTIEQKENMLNRDAEVIIQYLNTHYGVMNYTSESSPEAIEKVFKMSKSAFKRALGTLYKDKKVILNESKTILIDYDK